MKDIEEYLREQRQPLIDLIKQLCMIPAPSNHEEQRVEFCKKWLESCGAQNLYVDDALNLIYPYNCDEKGPVAVFMAHTDTVFPDVKPMGVKEKNGKLFSPGVGDNTANLAVLLMMAKYLAENKPKTTCGILIAANSGEEGLGNLKGSRALMRTYGERAKQVVSFDGYSYEICNRAVGSARYRLTVRTEGGHSYIDFGKKNAIAYLAQLIQKIYSYELPEDGSKTTYNVGVISGGTSVNTIAQKAEMLFEYRSDKKESMTTTKAFFEKLIADTNAIDGVAVSVEQVGDRPCGGGNPDPHQKALEELCRDSVKKRTGEYPRFCSNSTDCNIPMSTNIPAITIGVCVGEKAHTRQEWITIDSVTKGFGIAVDLITAFCAF